MMNKIKRWFSDLTGSDVMFMVLFGGLGLFALFLSVTSVGE